MSVRSKEPKVTKGIVMNDIKSNNVTDEKVNVGINIPASELAEMRRVTCVDLNGPAVLALARKGLAVELAKEAK